jgi:uncharacterized membrane protein YfcA
MIDLPIGFIIAALAATIIVGLTKGGLVGAGALAMPVFALGAPPLQAAAILLPIMLVQDAIGVWAFRRSWNRHIVAVMLPGCLIGIAAGWLLAELVAVNIIMAIVGGIAMLFGLWRLWVERGGRIVAASDSPGWVGTLFGVATGFTSQIAHAGGPPFQMWVIPRKLPHIEFAGTTAVLFTIVNWAKVPAYVALGQFSRENLTIAAWLMPLAIASTFGGVWLVRRLNGRVFYVMVNILLVLLGGKLLGGALIG